MVRYTLFVLFYCAYVLVLHALAALVEIPLSGLILGIMMVVLLKAAWSTTGMFSERKRESVTVGNGCSPVNSSIAAHCSRVSKSSWKRKTVQPTISYEPLPPDTQDLGNVEHQTQPANPIGGKEAPSVIANRWPMVLASLSIVIALTAAGIAIYGRLFADSRYYLETAKYSNSLSSATFIYRIDKRTGEVWQIMRDGSSRQVEDLPSR